MTIYEETNGTYKTATKTTPRISEFQNYGVQYHYTVNQLWGRISLYSKSIVFLY